MYMFKHLVLITFFSLTAVSFAMYSFFKTDYKPTNSGIVIILNGPSGSGKSSIQKEFQKLMMPHLWIKVGIDNLFDSVMPDITPENMNFWQSANPIRWVETTQDSENKKVITLFVGQEGERVAYAMNSAIAAYAENGCNVIVDYIAYKPEWLKDLKHKLAKYTTYYVAVDILLDILEQREAARGTSPQGHARSHYATVHGNEVYDIRVNSHQNSAREIAQQLQILVHTKKK
jgi:chloramphenicol 3-O phosphotransferase